MTEAKVCVVCKQAQNDWTVTSPKRALELLARLDCPDGLSRSDALRLAARLLAWTESEGFRCEAVSAAGSANRGLSSGQPA
jgi:hypothetical protein